MTRPNPFRYFKTSPEIIRLAVMLYVRFPLSLRNVEDLLHERGVDVSHETVRYWWHRFGPMFAAEIRRRRIGSMKSSRWQWHLDEVFVKINGARHYLWRAVDHEGEVLESVVTKRRDKKAALKFLKKSMKRHGRPEVIVTDRLRSHGAALKDLGRGDDREMGRWLNNRAENSHLPFQRRERAMLRFRRMLTLQKFVAVYSSVHNLFNQELTLSSRDNFKAKRAAALGSSGLNSVPSNAERVWPNRDRFAFVRQHRQPVRSEGIVRMPDAEFEAILTRAAEEGAKRARADVGLDGDEAALDIRDLRSLVDCIRLVRRTAMQTAVRMITTGVMLALLAGIASKLKIFGGGP